MKSDQEKILEIYHSFEAVKDCFALVRIQEALRLVSDDMIHTPIAQQEEIKKLYAERDQILKKYPDTMISE